MKQGGFNFYENLKSELLKRGRTQYEAGRCACHENGIILFFYVYNFTMTAQGYQNVTNFFQSLKKDLLSYYEGEVDGRLGVEIRKEDKTLNLK